MTHRPAGLCACTWGYRCPYHRPDPTGDQPPMPTMQDAMRQALADAFQQHDVTVSGHSVNDLADATAAHLNRSDWALFKADPGSKLYFAPSHPDHEVAFLMLAVQELAKLPTHDAARAARYLADRYAPEADT